MLTYLLITLIIFFGHSEDLLGTTLLSRPLVLGPLVGLVLGDMHQGIIIGASLELIFMGNIKVGAAIPPDVVTGGVLGTAFAIMSGARLITFDRDFRVFRGLDWFDPSRAR